MRAEMRYRRSRGSPCSGTGTTSHSNAAAWPPSTQSSDSSAQVGIDSPGTQISPLDAPKAANRNESAQDYSRVVAALNCKWRVTECRDGAQWILQSRDTRKALCSGIWRGRSYCRTKEALLRVCAIHGGEINPTAAAALAELPDRIEAPNLPAQSPATRSAAEEHI